LIWLAIGLAIGEKIFHFLELAKQLDNQGKTTKAEVKDEQSSDPYRWIRHPGYAGTLLTHLATPVFLDSSWAFLPTAFVTILFVIRTALEDRFLQDELEGYRDYAKQVHYRLLPGVW
jgi:protein-S-isoprenylcysteine O-methyltransferase Ste14